MRSSAISRRLAITQMKVAQGPRAALTSPAYSAATLLLDVLPDRAPPPATRAVGAPWNAKAQG
eukprot:2634844-Alexandrium_andersonii.AAC.1